MHSVAYRLLKHSAADVIVNNRWQRRADLPQTASGLRLERRSRSAVIGRAALSLLILFHLPLPETVSPAVFMVMRSLTGLVSV